MYISIHACIMYVYIPMAPFSSIHMAIRRAIRKRMHRKRNGKQRKNKQSKVKRGKQRKQENQREAMVGAKID